MAVVRGKDLPKNRMIGLIYHPLYNKAFDDLFRRIRSHESNSKPIPKQDILRQLITNKRDGTMSFFGYISDQAPKWENIHCWLPFLNHDTPVFTGGEKIMRRMNDAVYYAELTRPRRGYYSLTYKLITKQPNELPGSKSHVVSSACSKRLSAMSRHITSGAITDGSARTRSSTAVSKL